MGEGLHPNPSHKSKVIGAPGCNDIVDCVVEDSDGTLHTLVNDALDKHEILISVGPRERNKLTSNPDNHQRLCCKEREHHRPQNGRQQDFIDAVALMSLLEHIQGEGQGRQDTALYSTSKSLIQCQKKKIRSFIEWVRSFDIKSKRNISRQDILCKIHINSSRNDPIIPRLSPITPVERSSPLNIIDHAPEQTYTPPFPTRRR